MGQFGIYSPQGLLEVNKLLIKFAHACERLLQIVGAGVDLHGHSIQARARIDLHILHGLLQGSHVAGHFIDRVHGFFHARLRYGGSLQQRRFSFFLALGDLFDALLQFHDFAVYCYHGGGS